MQLIIVALAIVSLLLGSPASRADERYVPPASPRATYNFNPDWRFQRAARAGDDIAGFEAKDFEDAAWQTVSTPHPYNDVDSFRTIISHGGGDRGTYKGPSYGGINRRVAARYGDDLSDAAGL